MAQRETTYRGSPHGGGTAHMPPSSRAAGHPASRAAGPGIGQRGHAAGGNAGIQRGQMHAGARAPAGGVMTGRHPGTNSALGRHVAQNPYGLAAQRHSQALSGAQVSARTHASGASGMAGHPTGGALRRYATNKPTSRVGQMFTQPGAAPVRSFAQRGGAPRSSAHYEPPGQHSAGHSSGPRGPAPNPRLQNLISKNPNGLAAQRYTGAQTGWPSQYHHRHHGPWGRPLPYPPYLLGDNIPRTDTGAGIPDTDAGMANGGGSDDTAASMQDSAGGGESTSVTWEEPAVMSTAIGHPGAGVFILERTGEDGNWWPVLVGAAPEGFGRRLEYVMDDFGSADDVQARLGAMQVRPNHPADRAVLRAITHDIVARIRNAGADQLLTNRSSVSDREQRLLDQQPPEYGGETPDYLSA